MNRIARILLLVVAGAAALAASARAPEFERLESAWNTAHLRADAGALDRLWHNDLQVIVPRMPAMSKPEALRFVRSGRMSFQRYETSELSVRTYRDAAVVSGRLRRSRTLNGQAVNDDWRFTKVYVRDGGIWRVVAFHASEAARE